MRRIELPPGGVFVDVGCGKGRVLLLASRYPFDQVIGLEISPTLSEVAERNVRAYRHYYPDGCPVRVECVNILDYEMSGAETVFFLYSPFDREVTKTFLENLSRSIKEQPRDLWLIIDEFRFPDLLDDSAELQIDGIYEYGAAVFHIYRHKDMS